MGVIKQGILGGVSGKVGSVVGTSWKGIAILKALPLSVTNPKTAGQILQRGKMTNIVAFAGSILSDVIKPLWDRFAQKMSGYNDFVSTNIEHFENALLSNPSTLIISKGKMSSTGIANITPTPLSGAINIEWDSDAGEGLKLATDIAYAVVVDSVSGKVLVAGTTNALRSAEAMTLTAPAPFSAAINLHVYLAFKRADGTVVSDNSYSLYEA